MSTYRVLVSCPLIIDAIDEFAETFAQHDIAYDVIEVDQQLSEQQLLEVIGPYHGILAGDDEITRDVIAEADHLQVISKWGIGTDGIDHDAAAAHGIAVANTPGVFNDEVADVVIGYTVMLTRGLHLVDAAVRRGEWATPQGVSLAQRTMGVIGVGGIGAGVLRRAHSMGMELLANDIVPIDDELRERYDVRQVELPELLAAADVVSLNCVLTDATRGIIGTSELELLGPDGYLINTARGGLIDEPALITALQERSIAGAALDVFAAEPLDPDHPFTQMEHVILGSHNAQNTAEAVTRTHELAVRNLIEGLTPT